MTPEELEAGHKRAAREFVSYSSIWRRSLGLPGALKRLAYNVAWAKLDPLWVAIIRAGLMPFATRIFERVLRVGTRATALEDDAADTAGSLSAGRAIVPSRNAQSIAPLQ